MAAMYETSSVDHQNLIAFSGSTESAPLATHSERIIRGLRVAYEYARDRDVALVAAQEALQELIHQLYAERSERHRLEQELAAYQQHLTELSQILEQE